MNFSLVAVLFLILGLILMRSIFAYLIAKNKTTAENSESYSRYSVSNGVSNETLLFTRKIVTICVVCAVAAFAIFTSFYTVNEQSEAVVVTFGKATVVSAKGLHFKTPLITEVKKVNTTVQGMAIGYTEENGSQSKLDESMMITGDFNIINVDFYLEYHVVDPYEYLYGSDNPVMTLKNIALSSIRDTVGVYKVDQALTDGKTEIQAKIKGLIIAKLDQAGIGLALDDIRMQDAEPPTEAVKTAFNAVENAKQNKDTEINSANKYQREQLAAADAEVNNILRSAEAQKTERTNEASRAVVLFNAMYDEYAKNPDATALRLYYEALIKVLPNLKVVVGAGSNAEQILPLDSFTK